MSNHISLKEAERHVFRAAFRDGLLDIMIGCLFLQLAVAPFLTDSLGDFWSSAVFLPLWLALILAYGWLRKHVLSPRLGSVKLGRARQTRMKRLNILLGLILLVALIIGVASFLSFDVTQGWMIAALFGFILLVLFGVAAYYLESRRLLVYGVCNLFAPLIGEWLYENKAVPHHGWPVSFGVMSAITIVTGLVIFLRLLRSNPIPPLEHPLEDV